MTTSTATDDGAADSTAMPVTYADVEAAARRLDGIANRTPVVTSRSANAVTSADVFFKCENFQRVGAFKFRGAYNALAQLTQEQRRQGVLAYSSGNHAQAIALAGRLLGIPTAIVMPDNAPQVKLRATQEYGAETILYDPAERTREELAAEIAEQRGLVVIPSFDHPAVIAGQGTTASELFNETGALDMLLVPCGGGGLISGCAIATDALAPSCRVIGIEPALGDDATRSFHSGTLQHVHNPATIADGARTPSLGKLTFPLVLRHVDDMVTVTDEQILRTMRFMWERMKLVVEPTGALATAALLEGVVSARGARIGVVISGGNVDLAQAGQWFTAP